MSQNGSMEFRDKVETAVGPLIGQLRKKLASKPTLSVLNHYQLLIDAVQTDKSGLPDGFMFKWRYVWALLLSNPFQQVAHNVDLEFEDVDGLIAEIFRAYELGAVYERGRFPRSEKEFLTRLGLALRIRESDVLGFPEQIQEWAKARFQPFSDSYFLLEFGLTFEKLMEWITGLIRIVESRLNASVQDLFSIYRDLEVLQRESDLGKIQIEAARKRADDLRIEQRLEANARQAEAVHVLSAADLATGVPPAGVGRLLDLFSIRAGEVRSECLFPHDENPLEYKMFVGLPHDATYFLDPASAYRILAKTFEAKLLVNSSVRDRYLENRGSATERWVTDSIRRVFPRAEIYANYYLEKGSHERDLLLRYRDTVILIECKNSRLRAFQGTAADLVKFERDFESSIQYAYEQALAVKQRIREREEASFFDEKGRPYFSVKREDIVHYYIVCVTIVPRGPLGTDLSHQLRKPDGEPFPLAVSLLDLDTICKHLTRPEQFIEYLRDRENLHGHVHTGDELNFAGYFLRYGNLDFEEGTFVNDDFSEVFDRAWFRERGVNVEEASGPPVRTSITRHGNRLTFEDASGEKETVTVPPEWIERATGSAPMRMKGSDRNKPCPCGSGRKFKHCHGVG